VLVAEPFGDIGVDDNFLELVVLASAVVDFLLLVVSFGVTEVEEDGDDFTEADDEDAIFDSGFPWLEGERVNFLLRIEDVDENLSFVLDDDDTANLDEVNLNAAALSL
jgi:hypothetical protein